MEYYCLDVERLNENHSHRFVENVENGSRPISRPERRERADGTGRPWERLRTAQNGRSGNVENVENGTAETSRTERLRTERRNVENVETATKRP